MGEKKKTKNKTLTIKKEKLHEQLSHSVVHGQQHPLVSPESLFIYIAGV